MSCFNEKNQHIGKLETLRRFTHLDTESVVRWCRVCGAVVVDREVDGRRMGCVVDMKFPEVTKRALKLPKGPKHILKDEKSNKQRVHRSLWEEEWVKK